MHGMMKWKLQNKVLTKSEKCDIIIVSKGNCTFDGLRANVPQVPSDQRESTTNVRRRIAT